MPTTFQHHLTSHLSEFQKFHTKQCWGINPSKLQVHRCMVHVWQSPCSAFNWLQLWPYFLFIKLGRYPLRLKFRKRSSEIEQLLPTADTLMRHTASHRNVLWYSLLLQRNLIVTHAVQVALWQGQSYLLYYYVVSGNWQGPLYPPDVHTRARNYTNFTPST